MLYGEIIRQHFKLISKHVVADTIDYLEMKFSFQTDDWDGLEKWAHFARKGTVYDIRLTDDCIRKEDHLNLSAGIWKVYLHGNEHRDGEVIERITTCVETLEVNPTGMLNGEPFPEMPASVTEQILARLDNVEQNGGGGGGGVVKNIYVRTLTNESTGRVGYMLVLENSNGTQTLTKLPDATIVSNVEPDAAKTDNGVFWYNQDTDKLYINFLGWRKIYGGGSGLPEYTDADNTKVLTIVDNTPVWADIPESGSGLPEHTDADEGKFMRIIKGVPGWSTVINGEEVAF